MEQEVRPKRKQRQVKKEEVKLDLTESFDPANAKDKDFDLDLDAARFQGKKGQAGTRNKSVEGGGNDDSAAQRTSYDPIP